MEGSVYIFFYEKFIKFSVLLKHLNQNGHISKLQAES